LGEGQSLATPDTCNVITPGGPVPTPFPNIAMMAQANPGTCAQTVLIDSMPACNLSTEILMTSGDEAGTGLGVVSGMIIGPARYTLGSMTVMVGGQPAVYQTSTMGHNGMNANAPLGCQTVPSQVMVLVGP